jgi:hypothetical protein
MRHYSIKSQSVTSKWSVRFNATQPTLGANEGDLLGGPVEEKIF